MYSDILMAITTMEDQADAIEAIDYVQARLFQSDSTNQQSRPSAATYSVVRLIEEKVNQQTDKQSWLTGLNRAVRAMSVVRLTLALDPSVGMVEKINAWIKANKGEATIVSFDVEPGLVGGAKISFGGRIFDGSVSLKLAEFWKEYERQGQL